MKEIISIIIAFLGVVVPLAIFLISKSKEQQQINFERFHKEIISGLYNRRGELGLDQQVAIIFELRNFPGYFSVTKRILIDSKEYWKLINKEKKLNDEGLRRLTKETSETLDYMNKNIIHRLFIKIKNRIKI